MQDFLVGNSKIGFSHKPFIIAEMSGNHNQSLEKALAIIDAAADAGADAVKLQTYTADTLTIDVSHNEFFIADTNSLWKGESLYELYKKAYTPWEWHKTLFDRAEQRNIICLSTPFDDSAVDFLEDLNVPAYKIASFENNHLPLLKKIAKTGKPVIMSTGLSTISDLELAVSTLRANGCSNIVLLKCTSTYPADPKNSNILTIPHMSELFNCHVGLSDHTAGIGIAVASIALGARIIEKHLTLDRSEGGVDSAFSMEPFEFKLLTEESKRVFSGLGSINYGILDDEKKSLIFKRSIYIVDDMKKGDVFTDRNTRIIRPGLGLAPLYYDSILGKHVNCDVKRGTALTFNLIG